MTRALTQDQLALISAARSGVDGIIWHLMRNGVSANTRTADGVPVLTLAVASDSRPCVSHLLAAGADPDARARKTGYTAFADVRSLKIARELIKGGVDLNAKCFNGFTPLEKAANLGEVEMVKLLLESGAEVPKKMRRPAYWEGMGVGAQEAQRLIAAHLTARSVEVAMQDAGDTRAPADSGMSPL